MITWRCTHIDATGRRRRLLVRTHSHAAAAAWVEQLYGDAEALFLINLNGADE